MLRSDHLQIALVHASAQTSCPTTIKIHISMVINRIYEFCSTHPRMFQFQDISMTRKDNCFMEKLHARDAFGRAVERPIVS
jgi:hypothetical protein